MRQSGANPWPRGNDTTHAPLHSFHSEYSRDETRCDRRPHRRACGTERWNRPETANENHVQHQVQHRHRNAKPHRRARVARRSQRGTQHEEHEHAADEHEHDADERKRFRLHRGRGVHQIEQPWRREIAERRHDAERQKGGRKERLIDRAIDLVRLTRPGKSSNQHAHAREDRRDEDDDDQDNLPAHADRGVAGEADEMTNQRVVDDALQPSNNVGEHRRPRDFPHSRPERPFHDRSVVPGSLENSRHRPLAYR